MAQRASFQGGMNSIPEMLRARKVAFDVLGGVLDRKNTLDEALERGSGFPSLPQQDRAFCRMLVTTALRRLGQIDDLIAKAEDRPTTRNASLQNILRLGVTQIMFMEVPDHAAVDTSVRLAEGMGMDRQKGFVNGVLRTMTRIGQEWLSRQDPSRLNTPEWLLKIWIDDYGLRGAAEIATANLVEAPLDISIRDESERAYWAGTLKATEIGAGSLRRISGGAVHELAGFHDGRWWVQDASAALPVAVLGDVAGQTVVDLCSAPGGKTMQLAAKGARVYAVDRSANRLKRLEENLRRLDMVDRVGVVAADAAQWNPPEPPRYIVLDAPCTATGTIRRHPDVMHLKSPQDMESLTAVQARILDHAFDMLPVGGMLVYCTCSLQKAEGEHQIDRLLAERPDARRVAITGEEIGGIDEAVTEQGDVRLLPFHQAALGGMDGFFISRITKEN